MSTQLSSESGPEEALVLAPAEVERLPIGAELGRGEGARVTKSWLKGLQEVVLKIAHPGYEHFLLREARALALAAGHHAPRLWGIGRVGPDAELALVMDLAPGQSLSWVLNNSAVECDRIELARAVMVQGSMALRQLHALGLAHGDVKPDNLMVAMGTPPQVTLIDFGLASDATKIEGGTPRYLPPEALEGGAVKPQIADTYALALTVAEILAPVLGRRPPQAEDLERVPDDFRALLGPHLFPAHGVRPSLTFMVEEARSLGIFPRERDPLQVSADVSREYLATRLYDLEHDPRRRIQVSGAPGLWLRQLRARLLMIAECESTGPRTSDASGEEAPALEDLKPHDRRRFLGRLIGPSASDWRVPAVSDDELVQRLIQQGTIKDLRSLIAADLRQLKFEGVVLEPGSDAVLEAALGSTVRASGERAPMSAVAWALALGRRPVRRALLEGIAHIEEVPPLVRLEAVRAARQTGDLNLANRLLRGGSGDDFDMERALLMNRWGDKEGALAIVVTLVERSDERLLKARALAFRARVELDRGEFEAAAALLFEATGCPEVFEVRALSSLYCGQPEEALTYLDIGDSLSTNDEEAARLLGVRGMVLHAQGTPLLALRSFERAAESASRAGAALEEATYLTGVAAAASDAGLLSQALDASERAGVLFESLGQGAQNARALLARASVLSSLGVVHELGAVVRRALVLARQNRDLLCEAYLLLALADGTSNKQEQREAAGRARLLVENGTQEDRLRAAARVLAATRKVSEPGDEWATSEVQVETRLDWWRARAEVLENASSHAPGSVTWTAAQAVVSALHEIAAEAPQLSASGPAFVAGAHLALRVGMADDAARLFSRAALAAAHFVKHLPAQYRHIAEDLLWIQQARGTRMGAQSGAEQLSDVEGLLRALSQRKGLKPLLNQVLDMLLLWTGVERGLLLLRAPGDRLVIRAARNLERRQISDEQRTLSLSMAKRALSEGRPIVAVDAMQDLSSLHRSVHALNLRSVLAVPLIARGQVLGVAYLDDRVRRGAFGERELSWVGLISTVAALAIFDERDRLDLRRALRRAHRAEQRLAQQLSSREAELELAERELSRLKEDRALRGDYSNIIGASRKMTEMLDLVDRVAQSDIPALIVGESGTGKELIARAIALSGGRKHRPFVAENCGAVPDALVESTFFGHQRGAFTGASKNQVGLFELAHGGTLFLDEIGEMSLAMQAKLLRVLQEGEVRPLGASHSRKVDVRVLVATHRDLKQFVEEGRFREDLYYRLNVVRIVVPPLRDRPEDVPELVQHFVTQYSQGQKRSISEPTMRRLSTFSWPGNVRQLENEVRRMLVLGGTELTTADLSPEVLSDSDEGREANTLREKVDVLERRLVVEALEQARGNRTRAAEILGLSRFGLQKMTERLQIPLPKYPTKAGRIKDRRLDESR